MGRTLARVPAEKDELAAAAGLGGDVAVSGAYASGVDVDAKRRQQGRRSAYVGDKTTVAMAERERRRQNDGGGGDEQWRRAGRLRLAAPDPVNRHPIWKKSDFGGRLTGWRLGRSEIVVQLIDNLGSSALRPVQSERHLGFLPDGVPIAQVKGSACERCGAVAAQCSHNAGRGRSAVCWRRSMFIVRCVCTVGTSRLRQLPRCASCA